MHDRCVNDPLIAAAHRAAWALEPLPEMRPDHTWHAWVRAWQLLHKGDFAAASGLAQEIERAAATAGDAPLLIEAAVLHALAMGATDQLEGATRIARRAARMARTEAIPTQEVSAAIALARLRRLCGFPHLATQILRSLLRYADARFGAWIRWELLMAGIHAVIPQGSSERSRLWQMVASLEATLRAAETAQHPGFVHHCRELLTLATVEPMAAEATALVATSGIDEAIEHLTAPSTPAVRAWIAGHTDAPPSLLHGIVARPNLEGAGSRGALVLAEPGQPGRRIAPFAAPLHAVERTELRRTRRKDGRRESIVAMLALAGKPIEETTLFERVYGFAFQRGRHSGPLGVGLHRARTYLGETGTIQQGAGRVTLSVLEPILVPDPRCDSSSHDALLCAVAERGAVTASELAKTLGKSVRWTQQSLAELVADGACTGRREGRAVVYVVEDTTFSEPTYAQ